jgi:hypothetical protein
MKKPRRRYSRTPGAFYPRRWSEAAAVKLTRARALKIAGLFDEIGALWGEEDDYFMRQVDVLKEDVAETLEGLIKGSSEIAEQRRLDREAGL